MRLPQIAQRFQKRCGPGIALRHPHPRPRIQQALRGIAPDKSTPAKQGNKLAVQIVSHAGSVAMLGC
jgi:hypothetical protein